MAYTIRTKKRVYYKNQHIIRTSVPGDYKFTPPEDMYCLIRIVGAGAGGAFNSSSNRSSCAAGGSGAGCAVLATLKSGIEYNLHVGTGGSAQGGLDATATGGRGGSSSLSVGSVALIISEGGIGGNVWWPNGQSQGSPAPFPTVHDSYDHFLFKKWAFRSRGIPGGIGGNPSEGGRSVIPNEYDGIMGRGGDAWNAGSSSRGNAGYDGFVDLIYKYVVPEGSDYDDYEDVEIQHLVKRKKRTYYKYTYATWTQPVLASNTGNQDFIVSATSQYSADYAPWKSFKAVDLFPWTSSTAPTNENPQCYMMISSTKMKISSITIRNRANDNPASFNRFKVQASENGVIWVDKTTVLTNTNNISNSTWNINITENVNTPYRYYRFVVWAVNGATNYVRLGFPTISAQYVTGSVESTADDYDYYVDNTQNYCIKRKRRKYYKYVSRGTWNQPVLSSNTSAAPAMDLSKSQGFVANYNNLWQAFRKISDGSAYVTVNAGSSVWTPIFISFNQPKKVRSIYAYGPVIGSVSSSITGLQVLITDRNLNRRDLGTVIGTNAIQLNSSSNIIGKEIIVLVRTNGDGDRYPSRLREILMDLEDFDIVEVSAGEPYDYYVDDEI